MGAVGDSIPHEAFHSPSQSPAQLPTENHAVAAAQQQVHAVQAAAAQPADMQFQFLGGSMGGSARPGNDMNARHARAAHVAAAGGSHSNVSSPAPHDSAVMLSEDSPLPRRVVASRAMASTSRGGASTSRALPEVDDSPSTPRVQHVASAEEYASPAAMPPPGAFQPPRPALKPLLPSRKRVAAVPVNAPFKRPNRG